MTPQMTELLQFKVLLINERPGTVGVCKQEDKDVLYS